MEREFAHFLHTEGFIPDNIRDKILAPVSVFSEEDKAGELVKWIKKRVKQDRASYHVLVNQMTLYGARYRPILLGAEYVRHYRTQLL